MQNEDVNLCVRECGGTDRVYERRWRRQCDMKEGEPLTGEGAQARRDTHTHDNVIKKLTALYTNFNVVAKAPRWPCLLASHSLPHWSATDLRFLSPPSPQCLCSCSLGECSFFPALTTLKARPSLAVTLLLTETSSQLGSLSSLPPCLVCYFHVCIVITPKSSWEEKGGPTALCPGWPKREFKDRNLNNSVIWRNKLSEAFNK